MDINSPQDLVRALRAASDPPQPGGPSKIDIARAAWTSNGLQLRLTRKHELVAEFVLGRLLKEKDTDEIILDLKHWTLLHDVLSSPHAVSSSDQDASAARIWLAPILNKTPLAPIVAAFLAALSRQTISPDACPDLLSSVSASIDLLWPLAAPRFTPDALLGCFGSCLDALSAFATESSLAKTVLLHIGVIVTASYSTALANASNKKKLYSTFLEQHLRAWSECVATCSSVVEDRQTTLDVMESILSAGTDTLFSLDGLRDKQLLPLLQAHAAFSDPSFTIRLTLLPRLLAAYVHALRRHKGPLFGGDAGGDREASVRTSCVQFFTVCAGILRLHGGTQDVRVWAVEAELASVVSQENLYRASDEGSGQALTDVLEQAVRTLEASGTHDAIISTLVHLGSVDFDLLATYVPRILPVLLIIPFLDSDSECSPPRPSPALDLLAVILDYYSKTRTLPAYITIFLSATPPGGTAYTTALSSVPVSLAHMDMVAKATARFLTPGQVADAVGAILGHLRGRWDTASACKDAGDGDRPRKKRKLESDEVDGAIALSVTTRLAAAFLTSLPLKSVLADTHDAIAAKVADEGVALFGDALGRSVKALEARRKREKKKRRATGETEVDVGEDEEQVDGIIGVAWMRLAYALAAERKPDSIFAALDCVWDDPKVVARVMKVVDVHNHLLSAEVVLESFRTLLFLCATKRLAEHAQVIDSALEHLEQPPATAAWSGLSCNLAQAEGRAQLTAGLLHLLLDRWLPLIERLASEEQLRRLVRVMITTTPSHPMERILTPSTVLAFALRNAHLWELPNLRSALLTVCDEETEVLEKAVGPGLLEKIVTGTSQSRVKPPVDAQRLHRIMGVYRLLLFCPIDYLGRTQRAKFCRRALEADVAASLLWPSQDEALRCTLALRSFALRAVAQGGSVDHQLSSSMIKYLIGPDSVGDKQHSSSLELVENHRDVTLQLLDTQFLALLQKLNSEGGEELSSIMAYWTTFPKSSSESTGHGIFQESIVRFMRLVVSQRLSDMTGDARGVLKHLYKHAISACEAQLRALEPAILSSEHFRGARDLLEAWSAAIAFGRYLQAESAPQLAITRLRDFARMKSVGYMDEGLLGLYAALLDAAVEEVQSGEEGESESHFELLLASYLIISCGCGAQQLTNTLDRPMAKAFRSMTLMSFTRTCDLLFESLSTNSLQERAVHLIALLIREAPEGTLKVTQQLTSRCLVVFADRAIFWTDSPSHSLVALKLLSEQCANKPASLRTQDLDSLWSFLSRFLVPSDAHHHRTSVEIFHEIVTTLSSLVRLRRDLVMTTLPHLGHILRLLIAALRRPRPQLGPRQTKMVADTFPAWLDVSSAPLGASEATALARLLTSLAAKTVARNFLSAPSSAEKPASLARPFAKHAAYVVQAHVAAMNDALCVVPLEVRRELQPGLFALCGMMSEHSRDALMVSALDAGGKTIMKELWKEYEKQKYVGKG